MLYEAFLADGDADPRMALEDDRELKAGDFIRHQMETYRVTRVAPGHDEFDAVVFAEWIGKVGPGEILPP